VIKLQGVKDEDLEKKLSASVRNDIKFRDIHSLFWIRHYRLPVEKDSEVETLLIELAFLKVARPDLLQAGYKSSHFFQWQCRRPK